MEDLEDYQTGILRPAANLKQKEEIINADGTISQVTPFPILKQETKLVALSTNATKLKDLSPKECSTCKRKHIKQNTPIFCKNMSEN